MKRRREGAQMTLGADAAEERPAVSPQPEPEPLSTSRDTEGPSSIAPFGARYRVRSVEAVLLSPHGRVVGFGTREEMTRAAEKMGAVTHE